jgi:hypothetical protein
MLLLSLHAFSSHEHAICFSKVETHLCDKDLDCDCDLHLVKQNNAFIENQDFQQKAPLFFTEKKFSQYGSLNNLYFLTFSLRGPPSTIA